MNYQDAYDRLIQKRIANPVCKPEYFERHHIKPRALGGSDEKSNIVRLTAREHFVAHLLLAKIHGGKMWAAVFFMCYGKSNSAKDVKVSSRLYEIARVKHIEWMREEFSGSGNPFYGKTHTEEVKERMYKNNPVLRGDVRGELHHNFGRVFGEDFSWLQSMIRTYVPTFKEFKVDNSVKRRFYHSIGRSITITKCESNSKHEIILKPKELKLLGQYFRGLHLGSLSKQRDLNGSLNPNFGSSKQSGDLNGRFKPIKWVFKNKNTGETVITTQMDAYKIHGLSKSGVGECVNGDRAGTRDWLFIGPESEDDIEFELLLKIKETLRKYNEYGNCPHCGCYGRVNFSAMVRFHFDNCKVGRDNWQQSA